MSDLMISSRSASNLSTTDNKIKKELNSKISNDNLKSFSSDTNSIIKDKTQSDLQPFSSANKKFSSNNLTYNQKAIDQMTEPEKAPSMLKLVSGDNNGFTAEIGKDKNPAMVRVKLRTDRNNFNDPFRYSVDSPMLEHFAKEKLLKPAENYAKEKVVKPLEEAIGKVPADIALGATVGTIAIFGSKVLPEGTTSIKIPGKSVLPGLDARVKVGFGGGDYPDIRGGELRYTKSYYTGGGAQMNFRATAGAVKDKDTKKVGPEFGLRMDLKPTNKKADWYFTVGAEHNMNRGTTASLGFVARL